MTKFIIFTIVLVVWGGIFFYFGRTTAPEPNTPQPKPAPAESFKVPAKVTQQIVKSDESAGISDRVKSTIKIATFPIYFAREDGSFEAEGIYNYKTETLTIKNPVFTPPRRQVVYRDKIFQFSSSVGLLADSNGINKLLIQPINFSLWKFEFYPTVMVDPEYQISWGGLIGLRW